MIKSDASGLLRRPWYAHASEARVLILAEDPDPAHGLLVADLSPVLCGANSERRSVLLAEQRELAEHVAAAHNRMINWGD